MIFQNNNQERFHLMYTFLKKKPVWKTNLKKKYEFRNLCFIDQPFNFKIYLHKKANTSDGSICLKFISHEDIKGCMTKSSKAPQLKQTNDTCKYVKLFTSNIVKNLILFGKIETT